MNGSAPGGGNVQSMSSNLQRKFAKGCNYNMKVEMRGYCEYVKYKCRFLTLGNIVLYIFLMRFPTILYKKSICCGNE